MLYQLYHAGKFKNLKALGLGRFAKCESVSGPNITQIFESFFQDKDEFKFPIAEGLDFGHWGLNLPVPLGCLAKLTNKMLIQQESPLELGVIK
jgi:muramoyltetrapeptide carboxypeptidase LdcA involved in peptidoglycan recycling